MRGEADGGIEALEEKVVLERYGQAVQRANRPACGREVGIETRSGGKGSLETYFGETVGLGACERWQEDAKRRGIDTSWWAAAARLQKARATSIERRAPEASLGSSSVAVASVMAISSGENQPDVFGHLDTSSWDPGGNKSVGMRHSVGIEALRSTHFLTDIASQDGRVAVGVAMLSSTRVWNVSSI